MARYIDEENLIRRMHTMAKDKNYPPYADIFKSFAFKAFKDLLMSEPTADVQEVKHGKWGIVEYEYFTCSVCGESYFNNMDSRKMAEDYLRNNGAYKYCPWCGAKMDGKE